MKTAANNNNIKYWVWLQKAIGRGARLASILDAFPGGPEEIYWADDRERRMSGVFRSEAALRRLNSRDFTEVYRVLTSCAKAGIDLLSPEDRHYPEVFRAMEDLPAVIYAKGDLRLLNGSFPISVVGARRASEDSRQTAAFLAQSLTKAGMLVVSGGALGIDSAAHTGAMSVGGKPVCILGSSLTEDYLKSNLPLRQAVSEQGVLLSEKAPGERYHPSDFPKRNRLIGALGMGTIVVQAGKDSGSLSTARRAADFGRDVFAVPAPAGAAGYEGGTALLEDGAIPCTSLQSVFDVYLTPGQSPEQLAEYRRQLHPEALSEELRTLSLSGGKLPDVPWELDSIQRERAEQRARQEREKQLFLSRREAGPELSDRACQVYRCFAGPSLSLSELQAMVPLTVNALLGALSELEVFGYLVQQPDKTYNFTAS